MTSLLDLLNHRPLVFFHMACALAALLLGGFILARRKGTPSHKALGWTWVALMSATAITSAFIRDRGLPNVAGFTPIHLFIVLVAVYLPRAIRAIRRGNVVAHRRAMKSLYVGGCVIAGIFTLLPARFLGHLLWRALGLTA